MITFRNILKGSDPVAIREITSSTGFFNDEEIDIAVELANETLIKSDEYNFVIMEKDGEITGYSCFGEIPCTKGSYDLYWIAVHKNYQGAGYGTMILKKTEEDIISRNGRLIYIETSGREQYRSTRGFYEKSGYTLCAEFPDFYDVNDPKSVYGKKLK